MSLWGRVFGTDEAIKETITSVRDGLDALVYTDEEKANDASKERAEARQMVVRWMDATKGQNLARRLIALSITAIWLVQYVAAMGVNIASVWITDDRLVQTALAIKTSASQMDGAVMLILGFYFAAPYMGSIADKALSRFGR